MKILIYIFPLIILFGCAMNRNEEIKDTNRDLAASMEKVAKARVFFGHQSVGENIVSGLQALLADSSLPRIRIVSASEPLGAMPSYFAHAAIGKNGSPITKCDDFAKAVRSLAADSLQLAFMKFCFADFGPETNVDDLFRYYTATIARLEAEYPKVRFVHVTAPLLAESPLWRRIARMVLRRENSVESQNRKINLFNRQLTSLYGMQRVFDLARRESTLRDGTRCLMAGNDTTEFALAGDYTSDGGHLNAVGRDLAARELLRTLAQARQ